MNLNFRRGLAAFFVLFFLLASLPLVFITSGRLYNPKKSEFEKTTLLIIESEPKGATILLNNKNPLNWWAHYAPLLRDRVYETPKRLHYLLPDNYELSLSKNGYITWRISVTLEGDQSTIIDNVKLWPSDIQGPLLPTSSQLVRISPQQRSAAYVGQDEQLHIFSLTEKKSQTISIDGESISDIWWEPSERGLLIKNSKGFYHVTLLNGSVKPAPITNTVEQIIWNKGNENIIYAIGNRSIETYTISSNTISAENIEGMIDITSFKNRLTLLSSDGLNIISNNKKDLFPSPDSSTLSKILSEDAVWIYITNTQGKLYRFHKPSSQWQALNVDNTKGIAVTNSSNEAIWWNEFEIGNLDLDSNSSNVQSRTGELVLDVFIDESYENNHHLIITKEKISALDKLPNGAFMNSALLSLTEIDRGFFNDTTKELTLIIKDENGQFNIWRYLTALDELSILLLQPQ